MFPSQVPEYNDDDLIGTDATTAQSNFDPQHPLYRAIGRLAELTRRHPALRDGAQQHRLSGPGAGVYAFSRIDRRAQREYVVALNNTEEARTAAIPTYVERADFRRIYGDGPRRLRSGGDRPAHRHRAAARRRRVRAARQDPARAPDAVRRARRARAGRRVARADRGARRARRQLVLRGHVPRPRRPRRLAADRHRRQRALPRVPRRERPARPARSSTTRRSCSTTAATRARAARAARPCRRRRSRSRRRRRARRCAERSRCAPIADPERATHVVAFERSVAGGAVDADRERRLLARVHGVRRHLRPRTWPPARRSATARSSWSPTARAW